MSAANSSIRQAREALKKYLWHPLRYNYPMVMLNWRFKYAKPVGLNQRIRHHMVFNRDPLLKTWADKLAVRDWAKSNVPELRFPKIIQVVDSAKDIKFTQLPRNFVLKTNHASGSTIVVTEHADPNEPMANRFEKKRAKFKGIVVHPDKFNVELAIRTLDSWADQDYSHRVKYIAEWAYRGLPRKIFVEEYLSNNGEPINDFKILVLNGRVAYIQFHTDIYGDHVRDCFDTNWNPLFISGKGLLQSDPENLPKRPKQLEDMVRLSEQIGAFSPIARCDYYVVGDVLYMGEITNYPNGGNMPHEPAEYWDNKFDKDYF